MKFYDCQYTIVEKSHSFSFLCNETHINSKNPTFSQEGCDEPIEPKSSLAQVKYSKKDYNFPQNSDEQGFYHSKRIIRWETFSFSSATKTEALRDCSKRLPFSGTTSDCSLNYVIHVYFVLTTNTLCNSFKVMNITTSIWLKTV